MLVAFPPIVTRVQVNQQKLQIRFSQVQVPFYLQHFLSRCIKEPKSIKKEEEKDSINYQRRKATIGSLRYVHLTQEGSHC